MNKLMHGDCMELMKSIPDGSIDMVLCDLPYGTTRNKWDSAIPLDELWKQYKRIVKRGGAILLFGQIPFTASLCNSNPQMLRYEWIWEKTQGTGHLNSHKMPLKSHENILVFYDGLPVYNPQFAKGGKPYKCKSGRGSENYGEQVRVTTESNGDRYPTDILYFDRDRSEKLHPTQKPVALLEYLIRTYTNEGDTVLDNCMGVGSTGVACKKCNRDFIGIEIDEKYFEIAESRITK